MSFSDFVNDFNQNDTLDKTSIEKNPYKSLLHQPCVVALRALLYLMGRLAFVRTSGEASEKSMAT